MNEFPDITKVSSGAFDNGRRTGNRIVIAGVNWLKQHINIEGTPPAPLCRAMAR